jgi:hypothetical protein
MTSAMLAISLALIHAQQAHAPMSALNHLIEAKAELLREEQAQIAAAQARRSA